MHRETVRGRSNPERRKSDCAQTGDSSHASSCTIAIALTARLFFLLLVLCSLLVISLRDHAQAQHRMRTQQHQYRAHFASMTMVLASAVSRFGYGYVSIVLGYYHWLLACGDDHTNYCHVLELTVGSLT